LLTGTCRLASEFVLDLALLHGLERLRVRSCLSGKVLLVRNGDLLRLLWLGFLLLHHNLLLHGRVLGTLRRRLLRDVRLHVPLGHRSLGLLGVVLLGTPVVSTSAALLRF